MAVELWRINDGSGGRARKMVMAEVMSEHNEKHCNNINKTRKEIYMVACVYI